MVKLIAMIHLIAIITYQVRNGLVTTSLQTYNGLLIELKKSMDLGICP